MGKKTVIINGVVCIILVAILTPHIVEYFRIEGLVKDLHSEDESVQNKAVSGLVEYGVEVIPRIVEEFPRLPEPKRTHPTLSYFTLGNKFEFGFIKTIIEMGEPGIKQILKSVDDPKSRYALNVLIVIVYFYGSHFGDSQWLNLFCFYDEDDSNSPLGRSEYYSGRQTTFFSYPFSLQVLQKTTKLTDGKKSIEAEPPSIKHILELILQRESLMLYWKKTPHAPSFTLKSKEFKFKDESILFEVGEALKRINSRSEN